MDLLRISFRRRKLLRVAVPAHIRELAKRYGQPDRFEKDDTYLISEAIKVLRVPTVSGNDVTTLHVVNSNKAPTDSLTAVTDIASHSDNPRGQSPDLIRQRMQLFQDPFRGRKEVLAQLSYHCLEAKTGIEVRWREKLPTSVVLAKQRRQSIWQHADLDLKEASEYPSSALLLGERIAVLPFRNHLGLTCDSRSTARRPVREYRYHSSRNRCECANYNSRPVSQVSHLVRERTELDCHIAPPVMDLILP